MSSDATPVASSPPELPDIDQPPEPPVDVEESDEEYEKIGNSLTPMPRQVQLLRSALEFKDEALVARVLQRFGNEFGPRMGECVKSAAMDDPPLCSLVITYLLRALHPVQDAESRKTPKRVMWLCRETAECSLGALPNELMSIAEEWLSTLQSHTVVQVLRTMAILARRVPNKNSFKQGGAVQLVLDTMRSIPEDPLIQAYSCSVIINLCSAGVGSYQTNQDFIAGLGGTAVVSSVAERFMSNAFVADKAMHALKNLAWRNGTGQKSVLDSDGVRITVRCMEEHPDNLELQKQACSVLRVLTATDSRVVSALQKKSVEQIRQEVHDVNGLSAIFAAIRKYDDSAPLLDEAFGAVQNVCALQEVNGRWIRDHGGVQLILKACERFDTLFPVLRVCYGALRNLSQQQQNWEYFIEHRIGDAAIEGLKKHGKFRDLVEQLCWVLLNLSGASEEERAKIVQAGTVEVLQSVNLDGKHMYVHQELLRALNKPL